MTEGDRTPDGTQRDDERSDLQQMVEARADAVARGEGGNGHSAMEDAGSDGGTAGTTDTPNQDVAPGSPTGDG